MSYGQNQAQNPSLSLLQLNASLGKSKYIVNKISSCISII